MRTQLLSNELPTQLLSKINSIVNKYLRFIDNVYLVEGFSRGCVYDLQNGNLYSIGQKTVTAIQKALASQKGISGVSKSDQKRLQPLRDLGLLVESDSETPVVAISELQKKYPVAFSWIEVTRKCNLKCTFCYEESSPDCYEKMTFDDFQVAITNLKDIGVKSIQFIGGEPMILGSELKKMILFARSDFDFIEVYTNGVFINKDWAHFFKEHEINVALSIHSYIPEEHDRVTTVKHSHKKVENAARLLTEAGCVFRVGAVATKSCTVGTRPKESLYSIRPDSIRLTGRATFSEYTFDMFAQKAITKETKSLPLSKSQVSQFVSGHQCFLKDLYIGAKLDVFPCVMERRFQYGNLKTDQLKDIIDNKIRYLSKDNIEGCQDCEYRYACFDCRPDSNGRGKLQKPWFCAYDPYQGEWVEVKTMFDQLQSGTFVYPQKPVKSDSKKTVPS